MTSKKLLITILVFLMPAYGWALGIPKWVKHLPKAGNDTYYYRVTKAEGSTYDDSYVTALSNSPLS